MTANQEYLEPGRYYHIYNRAVGDSKLFYKNANYSYFLTKYDQYISPIVETYAYCLMPNHFHFLVQVKNENEIIRALQQREVNIDNLPMALSKQFSNFFNGYSQAINKQQSRKGNLFSRPFKRKKVDTAEYLRNLILYIHLNPINHGHVQNVRDWKYSSYLSMIEGVQSTLKSGEVINWFEDLDNFVTIHESRTKGSLLEVGEIEF